MPWRYLSPGPEARSTDRRPAAVRFDSPRVSAYNEENRHGYRRERMKTLLVVEDEIIVAMELVDRLEKLGYRVLGPAAGGREAVDLAASSRPDAILMDIGLQDDVDGLEAARQIRAFSPAPIIFLTAYSDGPLLAASVAVPRSFQLSKLFDDRDLEGVLTRAFLAAA